VPPQISSGSATYEAEKIAGNFQFVDGVVWGRAGFLAIADVRKNTIFRIEGEPRLEIKPWRENTGGASGLAFDLQERLWICESANRRVTRLDQNGKLETVADSYQGKKFNAPNDIVVRRDGHVWFTDPAFGSAADSRELDFHGIWHIGPKTDPDIVARWQTRPNGIALSPDGKTLFATDSDRHAVVAFDVDGKGAASNPRDVIRNIAGVPGGIRTDVEGRLYVAARGVAVYSPQGRLQRTLMEAENTTNCGWGSGDLESLFICARNSVYRVRPGVKGALQY